MNAFETIRSKLEAMQPREFRVCVGDIEVLAPTARARFSLVLRDLPKFLAEMDAGLDLASLGKAYVHGYLDIEGDMEAAFEVASQLTSGGGGARTWTPAAKAFPAEDRSQTKRAIDSHYDLPVEFWRAWLDEQLLYTCAYYDRDDATLDQAQQAKMEHICRKLNLKAGERFLDVGCGWGALTIHATARHDVRSVGVTLVESQAACARDLIARDGLSARAEIAVADFRDYTSPQPFSKIAAVGIAEHLKGERRVDLMKTAWRLLPPGGLFLVQAIASAASTDYQYGAGFLDEYVFPGSEIVPISRLLTEAESVGFEVADVESLRRHYTLTLREWVRRLERGAAGIQELVGGERYRVFRAYLAGFANRFAAGALNVYQTLLVKPGADERPMTRAHLYR